MENDKMESGLTLECKHCHKIIADTATVAYHLVDGILYGWCEPCFSHRADRLQNQATKAA